MGNVAHLSGPDFSKGVSIDLLQEGEMLKGHVGEEAVLLIRHEDEILAISAVCSHAGGPLEKGMLKGDAVVCPWHHSCFSIRTGQALKAPALASISCWYTKIFDDKVFVTERKHPPVLPNRETVHQKMVIVGAGAAGVAAATRLRQCGFMGSIHLISAEDTLPYDRTLLSKEYMSGVTFDEELPLWPKQFYEQNKISLELGVAVQDINPETKSLILSDRRTLQYDACLLATGGVPLTPPIAGVDSENVFKLRSLADAQKILGQLSWGKRVVIIGAGFIGLEAAAALRDRHMEVHVVAPDSLPLIRPLGVTAASYLKKLHEKNGVTFHLGHTIDQITSQKVILDDQSEIECDLVIVGVGIRPTLDLPIRAGCAVGNGVKVNEYLETSVSGIYAAGDIALWPDVLTGKHCRVEHWEVAERLGQVAAMNMMGIPTKFVEVPFFWTEHYGLQMGYVGHSTGFDRMDVLGDIESNDFAVAYYEGDRIIGLLTVGRDEESLLVESALSKMDDQAAQEIILAYERRKVFRHRPVQKELIF